MLRKVTWALTLLLMAFIFYMSSRSVEASRADSAKLMSVLNLVEQENDAMNVQNWEMLQFHNRVRKYAHIVIYAALGILYFVSLYGYFGGIKISGVLAIVLTGLYATLDEIHQIFTHRGADPMDVLIDIGGGIIGIGFVGILFFIILSNKGLKAFFSRVYDFEPARRFIRE